MTTHTMILTKDTGASQSWVCQECARWIVVTWQDGKRKTIVMVAGDTTAAHTGFVTLVP
jgi:hypothetical protein